MPTEATLTFVLNFERKVHLHTGPASLLTSIDI